MQIKAYLKEKQIKISDIARRCGIPYTTVSEIINGKVDIDHVQIGTGLQIAKVCNLSFQELYNMCKNTYSLPAVENGKIIKKNKAYYLRYSLSDISGEVYLCKVNDINTHFVKDMAEWCIESMLNECCQQQSAREVASWTIDSI